MLHWCVPLRRCVVTEPTAYAELITAWIEHLDQHAAALERWYPRLNVQRALATARSWWARYFPEPEGQETHVGTGARPQTLQVPQRDLLPRLWKGPLRVLLEEQAPNASGPPGEGEDAEGAPPALRYGDRQVTLELNDERAVVNRDALFLPGDLLELPLFVLLHRASPDDYGEYEELRFDPEGSPYLGTSVTRSGATTRDDLPALPENMTAMRFQLLCCLSRGAFSALGEHVFVDGRSRAMAPKLESDAGLVTARGMIYSGSFGRASRGTGEGWWTIVTNSWGVVRGNQTLSQCVTTGAGLANLTRAYPVTPGWSCSPSTIFLSHYMLNEQDNGSYGGGSVRRTMGRDPGESPLHEIYQGIDKPALLEALGAETESLGEHLQTLKDGIDPLLPRFQGEQAISVEALSEVQAQFAAPQPAELPPPPSNRPEGHPDDPTQVAWSDLPRGVTRRLEGRQQQDPHRTLLYVRERLRGIPGRRAGGLRSRREDRRRPLSSADAAEWTILRVLYGKLIQKAAQVLHDLRQLTETEAWRRVPVAPELAWDRRLPSPSLREGPLPTPPSGRRFRGRALQGFNGSSSSLFRYLRGRRRRLDRMTPEEGAILGGLDSVMVDLTGTTTARDWTLTDINVISLNGHEWAIVRLHRADKLLESPTLPKAGHMAAWDPLTGQELEVPDADAGALYVHEATGSLKRWNHNGHGYSQFGCKPFRFARLDQNQLRVEVSRNRRNLSLRQPAIATDGSSSSGGSSKPFMWLWRLKAAGTQVRDAHASLDGFPRIRVYPTVNGRQQRQALGPIEHYHERAVPFPTMHEAAESGGFVSWDDMHTRKDELKRAALDAYREDQDERVKAFANGLADP